jgi:hypothetical protein
MSWKMSGQMLEACSCKMVCRCVFGPAEPDQGWCSGAFTINIEQGNVDGVSLAGTKAVFAADFPGDFMSGNGVARIYLDEAASADQRRELEAIISGKKGGPMEALGAAIVKWLPTQTAKIELKLGERSSVRVGSVGEVALEPMKDGAGKPTRLVNALANTGMLETTELARSDGSRWSDPDMRKWEGGGHGGVSPFSWSA